MKKLSWLPKPPKLRHIPTSRSPAKVPRSLDEPYRRVSYDTRQLVWSRDGGRCSHCKSTDGLTFDHIIAVSKGGSNVAENIELLCTLCNNEKKARLQSRRPSPEL